MADIKLDWHGDPLPAAAAARLGSTRWLHPFSVNDFVFSPDGRLVVSCAADIRIFDAHSGERLGRLPGHRGSTEALAISGSSRWLASVSEDTTLRLWDLAAFGAVDRSDNIAGQSVCKVGLEHHPGRAVAFAGSGLVLAAAYSHVLVWRWDGKAAQLVGRADCGAWINDLRVARRGDVAYVATERDVWQLQLGPDGQLRDGERIIDAAGGGLGLSPDDEILVVSPYGKLLLWHTGDSRRGSDFAIAGQAKSIEFSADGERLLVCSTSAVDLFSVGDGAHLRRFAEQHHDVELARFSPANDIILCAGQRGVLRCFDGEGREERTPWRRHSDSVATVSFAADGTRLASVGDDKQILVWNTDSGEPVQQIDAGKHGGTVVCFSPRGDLIAAPGSDGTIRLFDSGTGALNRELRNPSGSSWYRSAAFSREGRWLAACEGDQLVHLWDLDGLGKRHTPKATARVKVGGNIALQFSPDGKRLAGCGDNQMVVWRAPGLREEITLGGAVYRMGFVDNQRVLGFCHDGFVRIWQLDGGRELSKMWYDGSWGLLSANGQHVALAGAGQVTFHATEDLQSLGAIPFDGHWPLFAFSPCGTRFAVAEDSHNLLIYRINNLLQQPAGAPPAYGDAGKLAAYRLVLNVLPEASFADARVGSGSTASASPSGGWDFLGIEINITAVGHVRDRDELGALSFDPPASPLVPMCGYLSVETGIHVDIDNVYVVVIDEQTGEQRRGRLTMRRPTRAQVARPPVIDDGNDQDDRSGGVGDVATGSTGSWFTINLSEQVPMADRPGVYRVYLEHGVVASLRSGEVRVEVVAQH